MNDPQRDQLVAYLATLAALVVVVIAALIASANGVTVSEALGVSICIGGLIGVLRLPQQRNATPADPAPTKPVESEDAAAVADRLKSEP